MRQDGVFVETSASEPTGTRTEIDRRRRRNRAAIFGLSLAMLSFDERGAVDASEDERPSLSSEATPPADERQAGAPLSVPRVALRRPAIRAVHRGIAELCPRSIRPVEWLVIAPPGETLCAGSRCDGWLLTRPIDQVTYRLPPIAPDVEAVLRIRYRAELAGDETLVIACGDRRRRLVLESCEAEDRVALVRLEPHERQAGASLRFSLESDDPTLRFVDRSAGDSGSPSTRLVSAGPLRGVVAQRSRFCFGTFDLGEQFFSAASGDPIAADDRSVVVTAGARGAWAPERKLLLRSVSLQLGEIPDEMVFTPERPIGPASVERAAALTTSREPADSNAGNSTSGADGCRVTETRRVELVGQGTIAVTIELRNPTDRPRTHDVILEGGGAAGEPTTADGKPASARLPGPFATGDSYVPQLRGIDGSSAGIWQPFGLDRSDVSAPHWFVVREGNRILGFPRDQASIAPGWVVGWTDAQADPIEARLDGSRYRIVLRETMEPGETRVLRVACSVGVRAERADEELSAWFEGKAAPVVRAEANVAPIWQSSSPRLDRVVNDAIAELRSAMAVERVDGDALRVLPWELGAERLAIEGPAIADELIWADPAVARRWIEAAIAEQAEHLEWLARLEADRVPARDRFVAGNGGLASALARYVRSTGDDEAIGPLLDQLIVIADQLDPELPERGLAVGAAAARNAADHPPALTTAIDRAAESERRIARRLWIADALAIAELAERTGRPEIARTWTARVGDERCVTESAEATEEMAQSRDTAVADASIELVDVVVAEGSDDDSVATAAFEEPAEVGDEADEADEGIERSALRIPLALRREQLGTIASYRHVGTFDACPSQDWGAMSIDRIERFGLPVRALAGDSGPLVERRIELALDRFPVHVLTCELLAGIRTQADGSLRLDPCDVGLDWCRCRVPYRGGELVVEWNRTDRAAVPSDEAGSVAPGYRVTWRGVTVAEGRSFDPSGEPITIGPLND